MKVYMNLLISFYLLFFSSMAIATDGDIFSAVEDGNISKLRSLISAGADVNTRGKFDNTPLHFAIDRGNVELVKVLLEQGADVSAHNKYGERPLHYAIYEGNVEIVKVLLEHGADVNARNKSGETALHTAENINIKSEEYKEIVEILKEAGKEGDKDRMLKCESICDRCCC